MPTKTLTTAREFETIAAQFDSCELVRGEVITLSPGGYTHSRIAATVTLLLGEWARDNRRGYVLGNEAGLIVETDPDTVRGADIAYYSYERLPKGTAVEGFCAVAPNLVVEILGKGQGWREMVEKAGEYLRMGVDRVWVIAPATRRVHIFRPDAEPTVLKTGQQLADEATLPGFACLVDELFAD